MDSVSRQHCRGSTEPLRYNRTLSGAMDTVNHVVSTMSTFFVQIQNREPVAVAGLLIVTTLVAISGWMVSSPRTDGH